MPHFVLSAYQAERRPVSAIVSGSHCLNRFTMEASLLGSIKHAFWHDVWTNATHDDRDFLIARMLIWQLMRMEQGAQWPFLGINLYALLMMGMLPLILQSVPFWLDEDADDSWLEKYNPTSDPLASDSPANSFLSKVRQEMVEISQTIQHQLEPSDRAAFKLFWKEKQRIFMDEYRRRCNYNKSQ